ncbi:hypothetical protein Droror1_Dr00008461 [Drosera rotundifolia]
MDEFQHSLKSVFPCVLDINHLMKEVCPARRLSNLPAALSYLRSWFFAPVDIEIPHQGEDNGVKIHGQDTVIQIFLRFILYSSFRREDGESLVLPNIIYDLGCQCCFYSNFSTWMASLSVS